MNNILLSGANGFLGAHLLNIFTNKYNYTVYSIIRGKDIEESKDKLKKALNYYFEEKITKRILDHTEVLNGDIVKERLGLQEKEYENLSKSIDCVVNSAGLTKHYGNYDDFYAINVKAVQNFVEFAQTNSTKVLYHISTMSVSGQFICEGNIREATIFSEKDLNIGQDIEKNVYIKSKYVAEKLLRDYNEKEENIKILRVGNLTCRELDGKKQIDVENNAFTNRFKAFYKIGYIPKMILNIKVEFTPVDLMAEAIGKIIDNNLEEPTFHLFNHKMVNFNDVLKNVQVLDNTEFFNKIVENSSNPEMQKYLIHIINDISIKGNMYKTNIEVDSSKTIEILKKVGFEWKVIEPEYIEKFIRTF